MEAYKVQGGLNKSRYISYLITSKDGIYKCMYNWNVDISKLKENPEKHAIWKLEQSINFGLNGEKLKIDLLKKYWSKLTTIDSQRKRLLEMWLWPKQS